MEVPERVAAVLWRRGPRIGSRNTMAASTHRVRISISAQRRLAQRWPCRSDHVRSDRSPGTRSATRSRCLAFNTNGPCAPAEVLTPGRPAPHSTDTVIDALQDSPARPPARSDAINSIGPVASTLSFVVSHHDRNVCQPSRSPPPRAAAPEPSNSPRRLRSGATPASTVRASGDALGLCLSIAHATSRIEFGTSIQPIYLQHPMALATTASYLHEISGGRFRLGVGVTHGPVVERLGVKTGKPLSDMREYVTTMRRTRRTDGAGCLPSSSPPSATRWFGLSIAVGDGAGLGKRLAESYAALALARRQRFNSRRVLDRQHDSNGDR